MIATLLIILGAALVLWLAVRWDLNRRHRAMVNAAKAAHVAQARAKVAEIDAKFPGNSRRQVTKRVQARKRLRALGKRQGAITLEVVVTLGALALIVSAAVGSAALAGAGYGGLAVVLWGCGLFVFCGALMRWAPPVPTPDPFRDNPDGPYEGGRPEGGRPGRK